MLRSLPILSRVSPLLSSLYPSSDPRSQIIKPPNSNLFFSSSLTRPRAQSSLQNPPTNSISAAAAAAATDMAEPSFKHPRTVSKKIQAKGGQEGPATIMRAIGGSELEYFDPFIFMDYFKVRAPGGFPDHPHRGFEVVTYMLKGASGHEDFAGHKGKIKSGDVQWMTAGRGIVHSEWPFGKGDNIGFQIWINLSAKNKLTEPNYQELEEKDILKVDKDGVSVKIIAGESFGVKSPVLTLTPTIFLDFTLQPGTHVHQAVPETFNTFVYILEGEAVVADESAAPAAPHSALILTAGDGVSVWNKGSKPLRFFVLGGEPLKEPVVHHGTMVMNTWEEVQQAVDDYRHCRNGFERARHWKSAPRKDYEH